jgi:hypothetical protein
MFPFMGNRPIKETDVADLAEIFVDELRRRLPAGWSVRRVRSQPRGFWQPDFVYDVGPTDGPAGRLAVEVKKRLFPRDVVSQLMASRSLDPPSPILIVTDYISPRTRQALEDADLNFADTTGTLRLRLNEPPIVIDVQGTGQPPRQAPERRELQSLRTAAAGRGVRALCDLPPPYGVREFARRAGLAPATVSRLFDFLDREALIERETPRSPVKAVDWAGLLRRWARDYRFDSSNRVGRFIEPRTLPTLFEKLRRYERKYAVTGSFAASRWAPIAPPRLAAVFVEDPDRAAKELKLTPTEEGINVLLAEPFDEVVFERTQRIDGISYAAPSQVAADLLTGPGRAPQEAEALLMWMRKNERAWRS